MKLSGKARPTLSELESYASTAFDCVELYLTKEMIDNRGVDDIVSVCTAANIQIGSVHTPHMDSCGDQLSKYVKKTDMIASQLNAVLVIDSFPTAFRYLAELYPIETLETEYVGYENDPGFSNYYIRNFHLKNGNPIVLDTAHLHMGNQTSISFIESLVDTYGIDMIPAIHLADGTRQEDGLPFGEGTVDIKSTVQLLDEYMYSGPVVLEVPKGKQVDALEQVQSYL